MAPCYVSEYQRQGVTLRSSAFRLSEYQFLKFYYLLARLMLFIVCPDNDYYSFVNVSSKVGVEYFIAAIVPDDRCTARSPAKDPPVPIMLLNDVRREELLFCFLQ